MNHRERVIDSWSIQFNLTPAERSILHAAVDVDSRHMKIAALRRVQIKTIKSQVCEMLKKTECPTLAEAALRVWRDAEKLRALEAVR